MNNAALYIHVKVSLGMHLCTFSILKAYLELEQNTLSKQECEMQAT